MDLLGRPHGTATARRWDAVGTLRLREAASAYCGELVKGCYYEWAEEAREDLRRRAVDALVKMAELADADPEAAIPTLEQAIGIDPYGEELHRRLMSLQSRLGRPDAVRRTLRQLEARLAELDVDPDDRRLDILAAMPACPHRRLQHRLDAEPAGDRSSRLAVLNRRNRR